MFVCLLNVFYHSAFKHDPVSFVCNIVSLKLSSIDIMDTERQFKRWSNTIAVTQLGDLLLLLFSSRFYVNGNIILEKHSSTKNYFKLKQANTKSVHNQVMD